jgi:phosphatidylglycerol lysyltransferase
MDSVHIFITLILLVILFTSSFFFIYAQQWKKAFNQPCLFELFSFISNHGGHFLSHLMFLNDKYGYWAANKSVYFSLQRMAGRVIVLGDPIGDVQSYRAALKELQDKCKETDFLSNIFKIYRNVQRT